MNYLYYPEEGLFDRPKYWLSLYIFIHIWFLVSCEALVLLHSVITYFDARIKISSRLIGLDPAAVLVPVAFFFYMEIYADSPCQVSDITQLGNYDVDLR